MKESYCEHHRTAGNEEADSLARMGRELLQIDSAYYMMQSIHLSKPLIEPDGKEHLDYLTN